MVEMPALTIWQPYASLIAYGYKHYETRPRQLHHRGRIAIHAAARDPNTVLAMMDGPAVSTARNHIAEDMEGLPTGAIVAVATLADCIPITEAFAAQLSGVERRLGNYTPGRWAYKLTEVQRLLEPVPYKGKQGVWHARFEMR